MTTCPLEEVASGWAIQQKARHRLENDHGQSVMPHLVRGCLEELNTHHVAVAALQLDPLAQDILRQAFSHLSDCICHVITLLCPRRIVIGGGVSLMGEEVLFQPLRQMVAERVFRPFADCYDIVPAALGEQVVLHGALALARRRLGG